MKMNALDTGVVNFRLGCSQIFEDCNRRLLRLLADCRRGNDLANLFQPASMHMLMMVAYVVRTVLSALLILSGMSRIVVMFVRMPMLVLRPILIQRLIFLASYPHIRFRRRQPTFGDLRNLQSRSQIQGSNRILEQLGRDSGIQQSAHKHVAADAAETV